MNQKFKDLARFIHPLKNKFNDFDKIMRHIADIPIVLMGEATHGTHEFYKARAELAKHLITEKGFTTIALEGDFPETYRIQRYINFQSNVKSSREALSEFKRFPAWMWRNEEMVSFIDWLYEYNKTQPINKRVSIYGLDLYSLHSSISVIIETLKQIDPAIALQAKQRYQCFDLYQSLQEYGYLVSRYPEKTCRDVVIAQLNDMKKKDINFFKYDNLNPLEEKFYIQQNALVIKNAEQYYRSLFEREDLSWNIRDRHMMEMVKEIEKYNHAAKRDHKLIIWAHNSHIGDARATQMALQGELNIGQLAKEYYGSQCVSIGFSTYSGTVSAASAWGADVERKNVRPALKNSIEHFFHSLEIGDCVIIPHEHQSLYEFFSNNYLQRAIGVIYLPQSERQSHYFYARLAQQFDIVIHYDITNAIRPLDITTEWERGEEDAPETFPFGV